MSLPNGYSAVDLYLRDVLQFLKEFRWIYTTSNTEFIVRGTLHQLSSDWIQTIDSLSTEELNEIPFGYIKETSPISLRTFLTRVHQLTPSVNEVPVDSDPNHTTNRTPFLQGIKPKKIHEIYKLSEEISRHCNGASIDSTVYVDLGCGVGHLTHFLHRNFRYKLLGIEADPERVKAAKTKFPDSIASVKFAQHFIESDSASFIQSIVTNEFDLSGTPDLILIGLHACADLSVTALNIFLRTPNVRKLLIMPCCYHKMKFKENSTNEFHNVPLSQQVEKSGDVKQIVNRPFLRLAGQQTASRWRNNTEAEHLEHGRNMFVRGAIQALLDEDETIVKNRKLIHRSECSENLYEDSLDRYTLIDKHTKKQKSWSNGQKLAFSNLLEQYPNGGKLSEFLTCLQASIQSICENLVILDRLLYVKEEAEKLQLNVKISAKKIVNEHISPRSFVIIAVKNK